MRVMGLSTTASFGDLSVYFFANFRDKACDCLQMTYKLEWPSGASKGTPGDAKCVTEILGG